MKIVIDDTRSQLDMEGAALWGALLPEIVSEMTRRQWQVLVLDRAGGPTCDGAECIPFPNYRISEGAADSVLIQKICDWAGADVFISSGLTTPLLTPTLQILTLEKAENGAASLFHHTEHRLGLGFSLAIICTSEPVAARVRTIGSDQASKVSSFPVNKAASKADFVQAVADRSSTILAESQAPANRAFREKWREVREIQAAVGFLGDPP